VQQARDALRKADQATASGDTAQKKRLETLAQMWADLGTMLLRASTAEQRAASQEQARIELATKTERVRAHLSSLQEERARAEAALRDAEQKPTSASSAAPTAVKGEKEMKRILRSLPRCVSGRVYPRPASFRR
jgi:chromosome segregation ATPase